MENDIKSVITSLLNDDPWQLIVPAVVYGEMGKRGKCCGCFPRLVDLIVETSRQFHLNMQTDEQTVVEFISRLKKEHTQCETVRMLERQRLSKVHAA